MEISGKHSNLSPPATKELLEQLRKQPFDLLHQLMLCDITITSDGFFMQRDEGDIGYNRFLGKPSLNDTILGRMSSELDGLSKDTQTEIWNVLGQRYLPVWKAFTKYRQNHSTVDVDGYIG